MTAGLRSEARLLLACARTRIDAAREDEIRARAERGIDWDYLVRKAEEHQLAPLLYRSMPWRFRSARRPRTARSAYRPKPGKTSQSVPGYTDMPKR
jgi:hypothetical protein